MKKPIKFIDWAFELLALLLIGVMLLDHYLDLSRAWEEALAIGVIVVVYGLIALWWRANPTAMVEPHSTEAELASDQEDAKRGHHLTEVQTHYQQVIEVNSK